MFYMSKLLLRAKDFKGPCFPWFILRFKPENVVIVPERVTKKRKAEDLSTDMVATVDSGGACLRCLGLQCLCLPELPTILFVPINSNFCRCPQTLTSVTGSCSYRAGSRSHLLRRRRQGLNSEDERSRDQL